jgi:hypothetical protein
MVCAAELQQDVNKELWQALKLAKGKGVLTVMPVASYSWAMPNCREPWLHPCGVSHCKILGGWGRGPEPSMARCTESLLKTTCLRGT